MKLYFVAANHKGSNHSLYSLAESTTKRPLRVLLSYHYFRSIPLDEVLAEVFPNQPLDVFLDSGAFSAMTQGATIDLVDYARYIHKYKHLLSLYANLDVIKNASATWENQQRMEQDYGLSPLPVFHVTEPWEMLEQYLERYPYIALGVAGTHASVYFPWLIQCFKRAKGKSVYHGFGITTWRVLKSFPWYSVDSTTWGKGFRFGHVTAFDEQRGTFVNFSLGNHRECYRYASLIRAYGFDPADFADRSRNDRKKICAISALAYIKAETWLQKRWGDIRIPERRE